MWFVLSTSLQRRSKLVEGWTSKPLWKQVSWHNARSSWNNCWFKIQYQDYVLYWNLLLIERKKNSATDILFMHNWVVLYVKAKFLTYLCSFLYHILILLCCPCYLIPLQNSIYISGWPAICLEQTSYGGAYWVEGQIILQRSLLNVLMNFI
jgi:hypothetical protein